MHQELCDIANSVKRMWEIHGFGGGKINHSKENMTMNVHGYCYTFGTSDHRETIELLKECYPGYTYTWNYEDEYDLDPAYTERKRLANELQDKLLKKNPNEQNYKVEA